MENIILLDINNFTHLFLIHCFIFAHLVVVVLYALFGFFTRTPRTMVSTISMAGSSWGFGDKAPRSQRNICKKLALAWLTHCMAQHIGQCNSNTRRVSHKVDVNKGARAPFFALRLQDHQRINMLFRPFYGLLGRTKYNQYDNIVSTA